MLSNYSILYIHRKKFYIEYIFDDIYEIIDKSKIKENDKEDLKKIFTKPNKNIDEKYLINEVNEVDNKLLKIINDKYTKAYDKLKYKIKYDDNNKYLFNSNYIFHKLKEIKNNKNLSIEEADEIKNLFEFNDICHSIRKKYYHYITFNSIKYIYKINNKELIFMGEK